MGRDEVERLLMEEYDHFSKIYRSFTGESMPRLSPEDVVERCLVAVQEEIVNGKGESVLKAYAMSVAARVLQRILKEG
ncbi:MAG: hypothetical protein GXO29_02855 [Thermotogae bacterium]|nr:hypothetical protein [Thermotogota bacterium]